MEIIVCYPPQAVSMSKVASVISKFFIDEGFNVYHANVLNMVLPTRMVDAAIIIDTCMPPSYLRVVQKMGLASKRIFAYDVEGIPLISPAMANTLNTWFYNIPASQLSAECGRQAGLRVDDIVPRAIDFNYYQSVNGDLVEKFREQYGDYFLFIGAMHKMAAIQRKGLDTLFKAWQISTLRKRKVKLVVVTNHHPGELGMEVPEGVEVLVNFGGFTEEEIKALYKASLGLVFPSRCEGFGLPPLEAMALRVPVIYSDAPAHNEFTVGVKVKCVKKWYYDTPWGIRQVMHEVAPTDLAEAMERVYYDGVEDIVNKGYEVAKRYDYRVALKGYLKFIGG